VDRKYTDYGLVTDTTNLNLHFWNSIREGKIKEALKWCVLGADINWKNPEMSNRSPLLEASRRNEIHVVEFLFQWSADIHATDDDGWTVLHHAVKNNNVRLFILLIKKNVKFLHKDKNGKVSVSKEPNTICYLT
jgi:ankyrin repeat protein